MGILIYANALDNPFHYDDLHSVLYNPHIRSLGSVPSFFTDPGAFSGERQGAMYRPLLLVTYALNYAWGGQKVAGYRWVNLLLHVLCAALLYRFCVLLGLDVARALLAGLVFLVHPLHAEPVNYISARSDLWVSTLYMAALVWAVEGQRSARAESPGTEREEERPSHAPGRGAWGTVGYAAALASKSVAITFPVALALVTWARSGWGGVRARWRYFVLLSVLSVVYLGIIWGNHFLASSLAKAPRSLDVQAWTQLKALPFYLFLAVMPVELTVEHPFTESTSVAEPVVLLGGGLVISVLLLGFRAGRHGRVLLVGILFFGLALAPASLVPLNILVSERRAYLALGGLILALAWLVRPSRAVPGRGTRAIWVFAGLGCTFMALLSWERNAVWSSDIRLWEEAVRRGPGMFRSRLNLGLAYKRAGRLEEALIQLREGLRLHPDNADAWVILGNIRRDQHDVAAAESAYRRALQIDPSLAGVYHNLGNIQLIDRHDVDGAIALYRRCLELDPHLVKARTNLGQAYERQGRWRAAEEQYLRAVQDSLYWPQPADPELGGTWLDLGAVRERLGERPQAARAYRHALSILQSHPDYLRYAEQAREGLRRVERGRR